MNVDLPIAIGISKPASAKTFLTADIFAPVYQVYTFVFLSIPVLPAVVFFRLEFL